MPKDRPQGPTANLSFDACVLEDLEERAGGDFLLAMIINLDQAGEIDSPVEALAAFLPAQFEAVRAQQPNQLGECHPPQRYKLWRSIARAGVNRCADDNYEFTGYESEPVSGLEYAGARFCDPALGMFLTHDPARQFASPYAYVGSWSYHVPRDSRLWAKKRSRTLR